MQSEDRAVAVQAQRDAAERLKWRKAEEVERRWKREQVNSTHAPTTAWHTHGWIQNAPTMIHLNAHKDDHPTQTAMTVCSLWCSQSFCP
jgi:hypothetical protein